MVSSEIIASWVQAIGSILAIMAGFAVVSIQVRATHRENVTLAAENDRNARLVAISFASIAQDVCETVILSLATDAPPGGDDVQRIKRGVEYQRQTIAAFPLASLKEEALMQSFAPLASILDSIVDNLREVADTTLGGKIASPVVIRLVIGRIRKLCDLAAANLVRLREMSAAKDNLGSNADCGI